MFEVPLVPGPDAPRSAYLREPTAREELIVDGTSPVSASALLSKILVDVPGASVGPGSVWRLTLSDRDWLSAGLYRRLYGDHVAVIANCGRCQKRFEVGFSVADLLADKIENRPVVDTLVSGPDSEGYYVLVADGTRFRPPTTDDESALSKVEDPDGSMLLERLVADWGTRGTASTEQRDEIERVLSALTPILVVDLPVKCASCGLEQQITFDQVSVLLDSLQRERQVVLAEVHRVAVAYHWACHEILDLERRDRRGYVALIDAERGFA